MVDRLRFWKPTPLPNQPKKELEQEALTISKFFGNFLGTLINTSANPRKKATLTDRSKPIVGLGFWGMEPRRLELLTPCMPCRQLSFRDALRILEIRVAVTRF